MEILARLPQQLYNKCRTCAGNDSSLALNMLNLERA